MLKRMFDLTVSGVALALLAPLFSVVALWIKRDSPGPVFYRGVRTSRGGGTFRMFKFRTMVTAQSQIEGTTALNDPRVTRAGEFLRKYKIDELPQLINVFLGQMSLVGPRPELPRYTQLFQGDEKLILTVRPGITDYSSIRFSSLQDVVGAHDVDRVFEERVLPIKNQLRVKYVRERSFWVDLKILFQTAQALFGKKQPLES